MKRNWRKFIVATTVMFAVTILMACSKTTATTEETKETEAVVETEEAVEVVEAKEEAPTPEPTAEPTPEPTEEPTPEPVIYEGIDMESDLPGEKWMLTFEGIILEPKIVVFSDETGKKEIIEKGGIVHFNPDKDLLAVYLPEGAYATGDKARALNARKKIAEENEYIIYELEPIATREYGNTIDPAIYVEFNGKEIELPFELVLE